MSNRRGSVPPPPPYTPEDLAGTRQAPGVPSPRSDSRYHDSGGYIRPNSRHFPTEQSPLLQPRIAPQPQPQPPPLASKPQPGSSNSSKVLALAVTIFCIITLSMGGGAYVDRSLNQDPADPRVRDRIREEWRAEEEFWTIKLTEIKREVKDLSDRKERENKRRLGLQLYWGNIEPRGGGNGRCVGDGKKVYEGRLENFDWSVDPLAACMMTPVTIHGRTYEKPDHCEDKGRFGGVYGVWTIEGVPECSAYWEGMKDAGCTASGSRTRRFEAHLSGVQPADDEEAMSICFSTPTIIEGKTYDRPNSCPHFVLAGYYGIWEVPDWNCG